MADNAHVRQQLNIKAGNGDITCYIEGDTGDIHTIGEIYAVNAGDTAGIIWQLKTESYTASRFIHYYHTLDQSFDMTLPTSPTIGDWVAIKVDQQANTYPLRILNSGENIVGVFEDLYVDANNVEFTLVYTGISMGWMV